MAFLNFVKRTILQIAGILAFSFCAFYVLVWYQIASSGAGSIAESDREFRLVENLLLEFDLVLQESYSLTGSWAGDVEKGFSASVPGLDESVQERLIGAMRGDDLSAELEDAVDFISGLFGAGELAWFPTKAEISSEDYYVYRVAGANGAYDADSVRLLLLNPADQMLYFSWVKI